MNKITKTNDTMYIYKMDFNLIEKLYKYKTIFLVLFLMNSKMYD